VSGQILLHLVEVTERTLAESHPCDVVANGLNLPPGKSWVHHGLYIEDTLVSGGIGEGIRSKEKRRKAADEGGTITRLVLPQAEGNAAAMYFFLPSGLVMPKISMCSASQPSHSHAHQSMQNQRMSCTYHGTTPPVPIAHHIVRRTVPSSRA
jgi:hypothetical protein